MQQMTKKKQPSGGAIALTISPEILETIKLMKEREEWLLHTFGSIDIELLRNHAELIDSFNIVQWLAGDEQDLQKAREWLEDNRDELTTEKLRNIIYAAMIHGESDFMRERAVIRHADTPNTNSKINKLWDSYKEKGMSKSNAAPRIAKEVGLAESTIRRKLQGK